MSFLYNKASASPNVRNADAERLPPTPWCTRGRGREGAVPEGGAVMTGLLIVGAGIGGLTTALSLHAAGIACTVVEKARQLTAVGVGINLQPHAVRELTELGL